MVHNPFKQKVRQKLFDTIVLSHDTHNETLFWEDGREKHSDSMNIAFWRGYHGQFCLIDPESLLYVYYAAGREIAKAWLKSKSSKTALSAVSIMRRNSLTPVQKPPPRRRPAAVAA